MCRPPTHGTACLNSSYVVSPQVVKELSLDAPRASPITLFELFGDKLFLKQVCHACLQQRWCVGFVVTL